MKWSFQLVRIAGIDVRVHATFFLLLLWFGVSYYSEDGVGAMIAGLSFIIALFVCVVLHEFGHAFAARAYGIRTPDITLLPIGGVARLERMPDKPWQELVVALAGPAVNVVIAFALWLVLGQFLADDFGRFTDGEGDILSKLLAINIILVLFNLLPAFPMDGGRVLRALLAMHFKHARATQMAAWVGQVVAILFGLLGFYQGNPFLIFIGVFVFFGARAEASFAVRKEMAEETKVAHVMRPMGPVLSLGMTVAEAARVALAGHQGMLPVTDSSLHLLALIPASELANALHWDSHARIDNLGHRNFDRISADASMVAAHATMRRTSQGIFPVVNSGNQLVGWLHLVDFPTSVVD